jgi:hypothetical protein
VVAHLRGEPVMKSLQRHWIARRECYLGAFGEVLASDGDFLAGSPQEREPRHLRIVDCDWIRIIAACKIGGFPTQVRSDQFNLRRVSELLSSTTSDELTDFI